MTSRPDRSVEYVNRAAIKRWLLHNARPSAILDLYETMRDTHEDLVEDPRTEELDLNMLSEIYTRLTGKPINPL